MPIVQYKCKGIDNRTPDYGTGIGFSKTQTNMRLFNGAFKFIEGKFKTNSAALNSGAVIRGATSWFDPTNSYVAVVACAGAKLYTAQWNSDTTALTYTERTGAMSITNANFKTFASLNSLLIMAGGSASGDVLIKLTASTVNAVVLAGTPPKGDCVRTVNNYLFVGRQKNAAATYSRVNWSSVGDPETWGASDFVDFRLNDGDEVTALSSVGTDLIIFKNNSIGRLSTNGISVSGTYTLGPLVTLSDKIGCPSAMAVDNLPDGTIVFIGNDSNLYHCDGNTIEKMNETGSPGPNYSLISSSFDPSTLSTYFLVVYPTYNEIRIKGGLVYNYVDRYWYTDSVNSTENILFTVGPRRTGGTWNAYTLCAGTTGGFIVAYDNPGYLYPSDIDSVVTTSGVSFIIPIRELGFLPRFMRGFFWNTTLPANLTATFGWETAAGTNVTLATSSPTNATIQWPIALYKDARNKMPTLLYVNFSGIFTASSGGGFTLYFLDKDED